MSSKKNPEKTQRKRMSLAMQIFIALILAIIAGLLMQKYSDFAVSYIKPFGTIFLNLVKFIVGPIARWNPSEELRSSITSVRQPLPL